MPRTSDSNRDIIRTIVDEWVNDDKAFTSYNVSQEAKRRGVNDRHLNMKGVTHSMFRHDEMTDYTRSKVQLGGNTGDIWLYHPNSIEPDDAQNIYEHVSTIDNKDPATTADANLLGIDGT